MGWPPCRVTRHKTKPRRAFQSKSPRPSQQQPGFVALIITHLGGLLTAVHPMGIVKPLAVTRQENPCRVTAVPISGSTTMSSSNNGKNSNGTNGSITLKSFAELANVLDLESLPPGPPDTDDEIASAIDPASTRTEPPVSEEPSPIPSTQVDLASLIAQLAGVSSGLETMARQDARAREQATIELAQYEALAAERREAERALGDARRVRATAELLVTEAFTEQARADAARHAAVARAAEL